MFFCAQSTDSWWLKVTLLLEFGEFLYNHNCSKAKGWQVVQWAVDILLQESEQADEEGTRCCSVTQVFMHGIRQFQFSKNVKYYAFKDTFEANVYESFFLPFFLL